MSDGATNKKSLSLSCADLNVEEVIKSIEAARSCGEGKCAIESLDISHNNVADAEVKLLLERNQLQGISNIDLTDNDIGLESFIALLEKDFTEIALSANNNSSMHFDKRVNINQKIKVLKISECGLNDSDVCFLMQENNTIEELDIGTSNINGSCFRVLSDMRNLKKLKIIQTYMKPDSLKHLIRSDSIVELDITNSLIGDNGASILAKSKKLRKISVYGCNITDKGAAALAISNINEIELRGNPCSMQKFYDLRIEKIFNKNEYAVINKSIAFMTLLSDKKWCGVFYGFRGDNDKLKELITAIYKITCDTSDEIAGNTPTSKFSEDIQRQVEHLAKNEYLVNLLKDDRDNVGEVYKFFSSHKRKRIREEHADTPVTEVHAISKPSSDGSSTPKNFL
jgi:hypothetical protein